MSFSIPHMSYLSDIHVDKGIALYLQGEFELLNDLMLPFFIMIFLLDRDMNKTVLD